MERFNNIDFKAINEKELNDLEEYRRENFVRGMFEERRTLNKIDLELRHNYYFWSLGPLLITNEGNQFELSYRVEDDKNILYLNYIGVNENNRQKGEGSKMLSELIELAKKYDYDEIRLVVSNKFGMKKQTLKKFYRKFGFKEKSNFKDSMILKLN